MAKKDKPSDSKTRTYDVALSVQNQPATSVSVTVDEGQPISVTASFTPQGTEPIPPDPEPPEPPAGDWPNEPPGLTVVTENWSMDSPLPPAWTSPPMGYYDDEIEGSGGYRIIYNKTPGSTWPNDEASGPFAGTPCGWVLHDAAQKCLDFVYPKGMRLGTAPSTIYKIVGQITGPGARRMYASFWWKPSDPMDIGPVGQKICFFFNGGGGTGGQLTMTMDTVRHLLVLPEYPDYYNSGNYYMMQPNVNATEVVLGVWHQLELDVELDSGRVQWYMDGLQQGDHLGATNEFNFDMFQFSPTFGGNGDYFKQFDDDYYFRDLHVSVGGAGQKFAPKPSQAKIAPKDLKQVSGDLWKSPDPKELFKAFKKTRRR